MNEARIASWNYGNHPPTFHATIELEQVRSTGSQLASILVKRPDGKVARINLSFASNGKTMKAELSTIGLDDDAHVHKTLQAKFCWELDENGDCEYPQGDDRRRDA